MSDAPASGFRAPARNARAMIAPKFDHTTLLTVKPHEMVGWREKVARLTPPVHYGNGAAWLTNARLKDNGPSKKETHRGARDGDYASGEPAGRHPPHRGVLTLFRPERTSMRWVTLAHVHLDRVVSPWLVRRFVDPAAEFEFVEWGLDGKLPEPGQVDLPEGATPIGIPGVELGLHDEHGSCFSKVLRAYKLDDPALWRMERIVAAGISHALGTPAREDQTEEERVLGTALDLLGAAFGVGFDDAEHLEKAMALYDAVYEHCRVQELSGDVLASVPKLPPLRTPYIRDALQRKASETKSNDGV